MKLQFLSWMMLCIFSSTVFAQEKTPEPTQDDEISRLVEAWLQVQADKPKKQRPKPPQRLPRPKRLTEPVYRIKTEAITPIQVVKKEGVIDKLQTAVCTYTKDGVTLQVIGTVHVADKAYYVMLNERFKGYDALLYELVAPEDKRPDRSEPSIMRNIAKIFLDLEHQLAVIDYDAPNFVHADFTPEKFQAAMTKRGDTMVTIALSTIADLMRKHNKDQLKGAQTTQQLSVQIFGNPNAAVEIKRQMAQQFIDSSDVSSGFGATLKTYLIDERNIEALRVVAEQAKTKKKLGLYYGAAHLPDFDVRLRESGWKRTGVTYDTAWKGLAKNQDEMEYLMKLMKNLEEK